jgi:hypothetical protein
MRINKENFFNHYIIDPLSKELSLGERIIALSLSVLLALPTLGILHIRAKYLQSKSFVDLTHVHNNRLNCLNNLASSISRVSFAILQPGQGNIQCGQNELPQIISEKIIQPFYSKPLPKEEAVTVPYTDPQTKETTWRLWSSLTREQKIHVNNTGTREHNKLPTWSPEPAVDRWFFAHGQAPFLDGDPRESHGNDHAARAAIFSSVFAYLYQKYHPAENVSVQDIMLTQIVAAGHDSGRQTEGPDVYDEASAHNIQKVLKDLGITDKKALQDAFEAIENKDSDPLKSKSLIARCVQNADSAEFARLLLSSSQQEKGSFENSLKYLDIYKELEALTSKDPKNTVLKDGLTFKDFCYELNALRVEMNDLIYQTHKVDFRRQVADSHANIFEVILESANPTEFPLLASVLTHIGVKEKRPTAKAILEETQVAQIEGWINYGLDKIPTPALEKQSALLATNELPTAKSVAKTIQSELSQRKGIKERYEKSKTLTDLCIGFALLNPISRDYNEFKNRALSMSSGLTLQEAIVSCMPAVPLPHQKQMQATLVEVLHNDCKAVLQTLELQSRKQPISFEDTNALRDQAVKLISAYKEVPLQFRSQEVQTTVALALEFCSQAFRQLGHPQEAKRTLELSATEIVLEETNKFYNIKKLLQNQKKGDAIVHTPSDSRFMRKRKLGVAEKKLDGKLMYELSFEVPVQTRKRLENTLEMLVDKNSQQVVPSKFCRKRGKEFANDDSAIVVGEDIKISIAPGIDILIGNTKKYWNQYHFMRVQIDPSIKAQEVHSALAKIGLPMAMLPSRKEDIQAEVLARSIAFRFPEIAYQDPYNRKPADELYAELTDSQKKVVDEDCKATRLTQVGNGHFENVVPVVAADAWKAGVRSVGTFIWGGTTMNDTAHVVKNIIQNGLLSSQERFQNGILGNGCCPIYNYQSGSADQVFARILTKNLFESKFKLSDFAIVGRVFVMLDPLVLERMPYSYTGDRNGVRNPDFFEKNFHAQKQGPIRNFKGVDAIKQRRGIKRHVETLNSEKFPLNETMFDLNIGSKYIQRLVLWTEVDRLSLIAALQKSGIYEISGRPIEEVVVVAEKLSPELVNSYYDENPYSEEKTNAAAYI